MSDNLSNCINNTHISLSSYCTKITIYFLHIDEYIPCHRFVHIVQWSDISHFYVQLPLKSPPNWLFWLKIVHMTVSPTNFTEWNVDFIAIFTSYKLQNEINTTCPRYTTSEHTVIFKYYGMFSMLHIVWVNWIVSDTLAIHQVVSRVHTICVCTIYCRHIITKTQYIVHILCIFLPFQGVEIDYFLVQIVLK